MVISFIHQACLMSVTHRMLNASLISICFLLKFQFLIAKSLNPNFKFQFLMVKSSSNLNNPHTVGFPSLEFPIPRCCWATASGGTLPRATRWSSWATSQNPGTLGAHEIAGSWMFIPQNMVIVGFDPFPHGSAFGFIYDIARLMDINGRLLPELW